MLRIGLLIAMRQEVPAALADRRREPVSIHHIGQGTVGLAVSGVGRRRAGATAERLCSTFAPDLLLVLGVCGGVAPGMAVGDLLVADEVLYGRERIALPGPWAEAALRAARQGQIPVHLGALQTCDRLVLSRRGIAPSALGVDMESFRVAAVAQQHGLPALVVRAVSDIVPERATPGTLAAWLVHGRAGFRTAYDTLERFTALYLQAPMA